MFAGECNGENMDRKEKAGVSGDVALILRTGQKRPFVFDLLVLKAGLSCLMVNNDLGDGMLAMLSTRLSKAQKHDHNNDKRKFPIHDQKQMLRGVCADNSACCNYCTNLVHGDANSSRVGGRGKEGLVFASWFEWMYVPAGLRQEDF